MHEAVGRPRDIHPSDGTVATRAIAIAATLLIAVAIGGPPCAADDPTPPPAAPFQPDDISIGEPIALPFAKPAPLRSPDPEVRGPASVLTDATGNLRAVPPPAAAGPTSAPNGWLGMTVAESNVPGRWAIVEVAADGPAASAGVRVGDELRSIDGVAPRNADEVAQALTAIAAGQPVKLSVARADQVADVSLVAAPRAAMAAAAARDWHSAPEPPTAVLPVEPRPPLAASPSAAVEAPTASVLVGPRPTAPPSLAASVPAAAPIAAAPPPAVSPAAAQSPQGSRGRTALGVRTVPIDPGVQARFRLPQPTGAYVIGVVGDLPASKAGIPPGSVIVNLGGRPVRSPQELTQLVAAGPVDQPVSLQYVLPGGTEKRTDVVLQSLERPLEQALVGEEPLQPTTAPALERGPLSRGSRRPVDPAAGEADELRSDIGRLRQWIDVLERRLDRLSRDDR